MTQPAVEASATIDPFEAPVRVVRPFAQVEQEVLSVALPGYEARPQQTAGASFVEKVIADKEHGLLQAGTGVGKSLATLIPVIESGKRTVVATATNALLSQYSKKDMPFLEEYLGVDWALVKGRSNYVCQAKLEEATIMQVANVSQLRDELAADEEHDGDKENVTTAIADREWRALTSTADECPGRSHCPFGTVCFAERAKDRGRAAQVVVTNQMMLMTEVAISHASHGSVAMLGEYDNLVVDEAHELVDWATKALTLELNKRGVVALATEAVAFLRTYGYDSDAPDGMISAVEAVWDVLPEEGRMRVGFFLDHSEQFVTLVTELAATAAAVREVQLESGDKKTQARQGRMLRRLDSYSDKLTVVTTALDSEYVRWVEQRERTFRGEKETIQVFVAAPVEVSEYLQAALWSKKTAVLVSATLKAGGDFSYLTSRLGLRDPQTLDVGTSFDFPRQARLFVPPKGTPDPKRNRAGWQAYATETTMEMVDAAGGGALLLFTSRSAMRDAHAALSTRMMRRGYTVLMQGDATNRELAERFNEDEDSVLFALRSFMTGVSFEGTTCRTVILDKLPFPVPSEPVFEARSELINDQYKDKWASFNRLSIPMMSLVLEQAVGRLIRTKTDRGVMAVLDPRLSSTGYGARILRALPPATRVHDVAAIRSFFGR